jgi:STE24 endopeptidase
MMIWNQWSGLIVGLMTLMFLVNAALGLLNLRHQKKPLAANVKNIYSKEKLKKSRDYFGENTRFNLVRSTFSYALMIALFVGGFFPFVGQLTTQITNNELLQTFLFLSILLILNTIITLPFSYYRTFSIETRYGFNKSTKSLFFKDVLRNIVLSTILTSGIAVILHALYLGLGDAFVLSAWIALSLIQVLVLILNTKVFIKIFNKLTPLPDGPLKDAIQSLALKTGFKAKAIYSMDGSKRSTKLNAFFSGFGPTREIALFDTLIAKLNQNQILAVLAHEIGHAKHFDEMKILVEQVLIFGINALALNLVIGNPSIISAFGFTGSFFAFSLILFGFLIEPFDFLLGLPTNWLSRKAEYAADAFAVKQGYKAEMLEALKVLVTENFSNLTPHPLQVLLTYSHPPMHDRLAAIEAFKG